MDDTRDTSEDDIVDVAPKQRSMKRRAARTIWHITASMLAIVLIIVAIGVAYVWFTPSHAFDNRTAIYDNPSDIAFAIIQPALPE